MRFEFGSFLIIRLFRLFMQRLCLWYSYLASCGCVELDFRISLLPPFRKSLLILKTSKTELTSSHVTCQFYHFQCCFALDQFSSCHFTILLFYSSKQEQEEVNQYNNQLIMQCKNILRFWIWMQWIISLIHRLMLSWRQNACLEPQAMIF